MFLRSLTVFARRQFQKNATGTVCSWKHDRGVGRIMLDDESGATSEPVVALVDRSALINGHSLVPGQKVQGIVDTAASGPVPRMKFVRNEDGSLVRPRSLQGVILEYNSVLDCGVIGETDLCGRYLENASPKYRFSALDYECHHPPPTVGASVLFQKEQPYNIVGEASELSPPPPQTTSASQQSSLPNPHLPFARCVVLRYFGAPKVTHVYGTVRELFRHHGFVNMEPNGESIYFTLTSVVKGYNVQIGDRVTFTLLTEPPVSRSAGKPLAISLRLASCVEQCDE